MWVSMWGKLLPAFGADPAAPVDDPSAPADTPSKAAHGRWPSTKQGFLWDLAPDALAPPADGLVRPRFAVPEWVAQAAAALSPEDLRTLLVAEHERNLDYQAMAATSEGKASQLLTPIVALLTADATLVAFELNAAVGRDGWWSAIPYAGAALGGVAALLLITASVRAIDADTRVGMYDGADPIQRQRSDAAALAAEVAGSALARWTSVNKSTRVMYARAALSRALLLITLALMLGAATVITGKWAPSGPATTCHPATATTPPSVPTSTSTPPVAPTFGGNASLPGPPAAGKSAQPGSTPGAPAPSSGVAAVAC